MTISISKKTTSLILRCDEKDLSEKNARECFKIIKNRDSALSVVALDLANIETVASEAVPILTETSELVAKEKAGIVALASQAFCDFIASKGLAASIPCIVRKSTDGLDGGLTGDESKVDLITAVGTNALKETVQFFSGSGATAGNNIVPSPTVLPAPSIDIAGSVDLAGKSICGIMMISFPAQTYLRLLSKIMESDMTTIDEDSSSWAAEITNITLGRMKSYLNDRSFGIDMAIPKVTRGHDSIEHMYAKMTKPMTVSFNSPFGEFFITLSLK